LHIVSRNRDRPFFARLAEVHNVPDQSDGQAEAGFEFYRPFAREHFADLYPLFYEFYLFTCVYNMSCADAMMDINAITEDVTARHAFTQRLAGPGIHLALEDCRMPVYTDLSVQEREWMAYEPQGRAAVLQDLPPGLLISRERLREYEPCLSPYFRDAFHEFTG
jgi:hypothetical protein